MTDDFIGLMTDYDGNALLVDDNKMEIEKWTQIRARVVNDPLFAESLVHDSKIKAKIAY